MSEEQTTQLRWVKAETKPEHNVGVLVFIPDEDFHITAGMWDISNKWVLLDEYRVPECEVTHWMALPDIPQEFKKEQDENNSIMSMLKEIGGKRLEESTPSVQAAEDFEKGFDLACQMVDEIYSKNSTHPYMIGDCLKAKRNKLNGKPRPNPAAQEAAIQEKDWEAELHKAGREYMDKDRARRNSWDFQEGAKWMLQQLAHPHPSPAPVSAEEVNGENKELYYQRNVLNPYPGDSQSHAVYKKGFTEGWEEHKKFAAAQFTPVASSK